MAMAVANCKCKTCGKQFEFRARKANSREAASFEKWAEENIDECNECKEKRINAKRAEENAKAMEAAKEMGYPDLVGTEKQVAWASTIRAAVMNELREHCLNPKILERHPEAQIIFDGLKDILTHHTLAGWWIENMRDENYIGIVSHLRISDMEAMKQLEAVAKGETAPAKVEDQQQPKPEPKPAVVRPEAVPENRKHSGSVDIRMADGKVVALYDKDEAFREIVKGMGFVWGNGWVRTPSEMAGTAENIIAELGSRLLNAGFAVRFDSEELMGKAVAGDYQPMCRRWVKYGGQDHFTVIWSKSDDLYKEARTLPGAKYNSASGGMDIPNRSWAALKDFAEKRGLRITMKAQKILDELAGVSQTVEPAPVKGEN